jgi:hypothetical protein
MISIREPRKTTDREVSYQKRPTRLCWHVWRGFQPAREVDSLESSGLHRHLAGQSERPLYSPDTELQVPAGQATCTTRMSGTHSARPKQHYSKEILKEGTRILLKLEGGRLRGEGQRGNPACFVVLVPVVKKDASTSAI